jgi:hypothetical protein
MKFSSVLFLAALIIISAAEHNYEKNRESMIRCKLCQEMFEFNFDYEKFLDSGNRDNVFKIFRTLEGDDGMESLKKYFSKDNLEFVTKEISMQYFFKGNEAQIDKQCEGKKIGVDDVCDSKRLEECEKILSYDRSVCVNIKKSFVEILKKTINAKRVENGHANSPIDPSMFRFRSQNKESPTETDSNPVIQYDKISLIEMSDKSTKQFDSYNTASHQESGNLNSPQSWTPPKPIILDNFQNSIGDQLKEISVLAK